MNIIHFILFIRIESNGLSEPDTLAIVSSKKGSNFAKNCIFSTANSMSNHVNDGAHYKVGHYCLCPYCIAGDRNEVKNNQRHIRGP